MTQKFCCDRCGRSIVPAQNAKMFVHLLGIVRDALENDPDMLEDDARLREQLDVSMRMSIGVCRHLLPVIEHGEAICPGSPITAQHIPGQLHGSWPDFPFEESLVPFYTQAWAILQRLYPITADTLNEE